MKRFLLFWLIALTLVACAAQSTPSGVTASTDDPLTGYNESVTPDSGQPPFPAIGKYWVIDNGCNFSPDSIQDADRVFEQLRVDKIAEVAVICQTGVQNQGPYNDEKIWAMEWGNWTRLGDAQTKRGIVVLIRPDVRPEEDRITIENSLWIYQNTVMDYYSVIEEAANYANYGDFDGCLESLARNLDVALRRVVKP